MDFRITLTYIGSDPNGADAVSRVQGVFADLVCETKLYLDYRPTTMPPEMVVIIEPLDETFLEQLLSSTPTEIGPFRQSNRRVSTYRREWLPSAGKAVLLDTQADTAAYRKAEFAKAVERTKKKSKKKSKKGGKK